MEDIAHFLVECKEFEEGRRVLLEEVGNIKGAEGWVEEWRVGDVMERVLLLLGRGVEGLGGEALDKVVSYMCGQECWRVVESGGEGKC